MRKCQLKQAFSLALITVLFLALSIISCKRNQDNQPILQNPPKQIERVVIDKNGLATILTKDGIKYTENVGLTFKEKLLLPKIQNDVDSSAKSVVVRLPLIAASVNKEISASSLSTSEEGGEHPVFTPSFVATCYYSQGSCNVVLDASTKSASDLNGPYIIKASVLWIDGCSMISVSYQVLYQYIRNQVSFRTEQVPYTVYF